MGVSHLVRDYIAIDVQRCADVRMPHQFLLNSGIFALPPNSTIRAPPSGIPRCNSAGSTAAG
jgi:hypothetical protein